MFNYALHIARRLYKDSCNKKPVSQLATNIAVCGIATGLTVMIVSLCVVLGFKNEISSRIIDFGSDIQIMHIHSTSSPESYPINSSKDFVNTLQKILGIEKIERSSNIFGLIKTNTDYKGLYFKGICPENTSTFLKKNIVAGRMPNFSKKEDLNSVLVSQSILHKLNLKLNDKIYTYFFDNSIKVRRFNIIGVFDTNMQQFDDNIIYTNLYTVNQIKKWNENQCSTLEIKIDHKESADKICSDILSAMRSMKNYDTSDLVIYTIKQLYSQIFDWLNLLDLDTLVILVLMTILACLTMTSGLLILILEKTSTIGILKSTGATNGAIRKIFIYYAIFITSRGILWGYVIGLGISFIQYNWHIISMDASKYYVSYVPILFNWPLILILGFSTFTICIVSLLGPSYIITKITPSKAITFR